MERKLQNMIKASTLINVLESDPHVLSFVTEDRLPIWFLARYDVMLSVLNKNNGLSLTSSGRVYPKSLFKTVIFALKKSPLFLKKNKIIFFNSGVTNVKNSEGKYFNRVTDHFFFALKDKAVLIEDTSHGEHLLPRVHDKVYSHLSLILLSKVFGKMVRIRRQQFEAINSLVSYLCQALAEHQIDFDRAEVQNIITTNVTSFLRKRKFYQAFIRMKCPKVIFLEDASYGSRSHIILAAKKYNIPVIELQHGFVNEEHIAYRLGKGIVEKEEWSKMFYPDAFFAYGKFWKESINIPSKVISIGNPYLEEQIKQLHPEQKAVKSKTILYLSSAVAFSEAIDFLTRLKPLADEHHHKIFFRLHPLELSVAEKRYASLRELGINFSENPSLYQDFSEADIVIGELSTALFEAMVLKDKKQYLFMSSYTKSYFNDKIQIEQIDIESMDHIFKKEYARKMNFFWEENWRENFESALKKELK